MLSEVQTTVVEELMTQGNEFVRQKKPQQALLCFNQAVLLSSNDIQALFRCAETLLNLNRPTEASIYSQRVVQLHLTANNLSLHAKILYQMGEYHQALDCFERVIAAEPNNYVALGQRALCLTQVNRYKEALADYQQALTYSHHDPWVCYNYSLCLLAMGNLIPGFIAFEYRWQTVLPTKNHKWILPNSASVESLQGKSILVHSEQGLGDSIQFFRYIPLLIQLGARVLLEIQPVLIPIFSSWRDTIELIGIGESLPVCDYHCPLMSLARLFKTDLQTIPKSLPYVFPNLNLLVACQKKLGPSSRKRIGISWKGNPLNSVNHKRSIALNLLLSLHQPHLEFVCLQKDVFMEEKHQLDHYQIAYHSLELNTFEGTTALIACLDLVITIDTSIAHLAAAMGKEVWILLPFSADWRWFLQREDSPWYPTVTLFRQATFGDWNIPLARIQNKLAELPNHAEEEKDIKNILHKAHLQLQNGFLPAAEQLYRHIIIKNPDSHQAAQGLALATHQQNNLSDAIQYMQRAAEIAPNMVLYKRNLGELMRRSGQLTTAIALHNWVIQVEPQSSEHHYLLALAYYDNQQFDIAIQHYRIALSLDPSYGLAWNNLGAALEKKADQQGAKNAYMTAIRINSKHAEAHNNLGAIYSEEGQIQDAYTHFTAAISANPNFIEAHYNLSQIKTYTHTDPHLSYLNALSQQIKHHSVRAQIHYYFALGKALDDTQQYALAFKAYAEGNKLYAEQKPWNKTQLQNKVEQLTQVFSGSFIQPPQSRRETRCPIFIVGMPRAGTTLIEQILSSHAQVYGAGELSILDEVIQNTCLMSGLPFYTWLAQLNEDNFSLMGQQYLDRTWQLAPDKSFIVDKMPSNCFYIGMIYRMFPTAKIIHAIRDPMDSCFSCFTHLFKSNMLFAYSLSDLGQYYELYAQTMQYWQTVLPTHFIFDMPYERMVADHETLSKQLVEYIGLPWDPNCLNFYKHTRVVKTASFMQVKQPIYTTSLQRWQHFAQDLKPLLDIVAPYRNIKGISA